MTPDFTPKRAAVSALLLILTLSLALSAASCGKTAAPSDQSATTQGTTSDPMADNLPVRDYGGRDFNILVRTDWAYEFVADEAKQGEPVNDAIYNRNLVVGERFNVNINPIKVAGGWNDRTNFMNNLRNTVQAGDSTYDLVAGYAAYIGIMLPDGVFMNLNDMQYLDFTKPWWSQDAIKEFSIGDKLYLCTGDLSLAMWKSIYCMFFNKQLISNLGMEDPYALVRSGNWTIDKLVEMSKAAYHGAQEGVVDPKNDTFGMALEDTHLTYNWQYAFDQPTSLKDENNIPYVAVDTPKEADIMAKMVDILYHTQGVLFTKESNPLPLNPYGLNMFQENRLLFLPDYLGSAESLRGMNTDFGIIPYPKWDTNQSRYYTTVHDGVSLFGIPVSVSDPECCAIVTQALAAESKKLVVPAFYDVSLKGKVTRDQESGEMMDLIRDSVVQNFGYMFNNPTSGFGVVLRMLVTTPDHNYASWMASQKDARTTSFNNYVNKVLALN